MILPKLVMKKSVITRPDFVMQDHSGYRDFVKCIGKQVAFAGKFFDVTVGMGNTVEIMFERNGGSFITVEVTSLDGELTTHIEKGSCYIVVIHVHKKANNDLGLHFPLAGILYSINDHKFLADLI